MNTSAQTISLAGNELELIQSATNYSLKRSSENNWISGFFTIAN